MHRCQNRQMTFNVWAKMGHGSPAIAPGPKWRPRRTLIDLYNERDHTRWYWRMAANISTLMIMAGWVAMNLTGQTREKTKLMRTSFLIYPSAFSGNPALSVDQSVASIVAMILLAVGYTVSVTLWFICTSWLFQFDVIFLYGPIRSVDQATANVSPSQPMSVDLCFWPLQHLL